MATILVVDDDPAVVAIACESLAYAGYLTISASSGEAALALLREGHLAIDAAVVDVKLELPGMDGVVLVNELRQIWPQLPAVVITGFPDHAVSVSAAQRALSGRSIFVAKPVAPRDFVRYVQEAIGSALDGYARWLEAMLAVVMAPHDVSRLELWPSVLPNARSLAAVRHWCRAVNLPAGGSLDLARSLRAFVQARRRGRDPRKFLTAASKETADRFWRTAGADYDGGLPGTLDEWLARQQFVRDPDAVDTLREALRERLPDLA